MEFIYKDYKFVGSPTEIIEIIKELEYQKQVDNVFDTKGEPEPPQDPTSNVFTGDPTEYLGGGSSYTYAGPVPKVTLDDKFCENSNKFDKPDKLCCPYCGSSYYRQGSFTATSMAWNPVYKDGKLINKDPNTYSTNCTCLNCGKLFSIVRKSGTVEIVKVDKDA